MPASREKKALALFFGLLVICLAILIAYIVVGHRWNVTATNLDDIYGELDNYTVILCESPLNSQEEQRSFDDERIQDAPLPPKVQDLLNKESSDIFINPFVRFKDIEALVLYKGSLESSASFEDSSSYIEEAKNPIQDDKSAEVLNKPEENKTSDQDDIQGSSNEGSKRALSEELDSKKEAGKEEDALPQNPTIKLQKRQLKLQEMMDDYHSKGAGVLLLNTIRPSIYRNGMIVTSKGRSFGIVYLDPQTTPYKAAQIVQKLRLRGAQSVIALTPTLLYARQLKDLDIVISLRDEQLYFLGETHHETFYKDLPHDSSLVSLLISPSWVVSGKELS